MTSTTIPQTRPPRRKDPNIVTGELTTARKTGTTFERSCFLPRTTAEAFCSAMLARPDIITAEIQRDHHITGEAPKWYVRWIRGMSETAEGAPVVSVSLEESRLLDDRAARAAMQADEFEFLPFEDREGAYCIHTYPDSDGAQAVYGVCRYHCTCQDWQYRCQRLGIQCKHQLRYLAIYFPPVKTAPAPSRPVPAPMSAEKRERLMQSRNRDF